MIVYLATYPRSGNSLLQHLVRTALRHLTSQVKSHFTAEMGFDMLAQSAGQFELRHAAEPIPGWEEPVLWHERVAAYRFTGEPWRRAILPLPIEALTEDLRRPLAEEKNVFFLKTHNLPFDRYFEGESVIQIVRHPGATLWSQFRYQNDFVLPRRQRDFFKSPPSTLDNVIRGDTNFGSWADYQRAWKHASEQLSGRFLLIRFEELVNDQRSALERVGAMVGITPARRRPVKFARVSGRFPGKDLRGSSDGYERYYSGRQLELMWAMHGAVAAEYGFAAPDMALACPDEQIRRLEALLAGAWTSHRQALRKRAAAAGGEWEQRIAALTQDKRT